VKFHRWASPAFIGLAVVLLFSPFLGRPSSLGSPAGSPDQKRAAIAKDFVSRALRTWQDRLDLEDWRIRVNLVHPNALEPQTLGNVHWDLGAKQATISVLSSDDYTLPTPAMLDDMEVTIVHELVHIHLSALPRNSNSTINEEHAVVELTQALLKLAKHS
jgi:hypothetical protein